MAITTVLAFWTDQQTKAKAAAAAAQAAATAAQQQVNAARAALAAATKDLADLNKKATDIRLQLSEAPTEADVAALAPQLTQVTRDIRAKQAEIVEREAAAQAAQGDLEAANGAMAATTSRAAAAASAQAAADQDAKDLAALADKLTKAPLKTIEADAGAALTKQPWTDAKARVQADIPDELRDCATEAANVVLSQMFNERRLAAETAVLAGSFGAAADARRGAFERAEDAFRDFVANAKARFDQALAIAARVADPKQSPLTDPERRSVLGQKPDGTPDAPLQSKRSAAAAKRKALALAQIDLDKKVTELEIARAKARSADVDKDPETDPAVVAARKDADDATTARNKAGDEFTAEMRANLSAWQLAVPDGTWRMFADFAEAQRLLFGLKEDHSSLKTTLAQTETDYVTSLTDADKTNRAAAATAQRAKAAGARQEFGSAALSRRILGALRGDS
jgi:hypothetical protein